jgi:alkylhydroperoxidase family enzyme
MAFVSTIPPSDAEGAVREMYEQVRGRFGYVPNWAKAFSLRPGVMDGWAALLKSIQSNLSVRSYELATLAAARALRSSYCSLAHGSLTRPGAADASAEPLGDLQQLLVLLRPVVVVAEQREGVGEGRVVPAAGDPA